MKSALTKIRLILITLAGAILVAVSCSDADFILNDTNRAQVRWELTGLAGDKTMGLCRIKGTFFTPDNLNDTLHYSIEWASGKVDAGTTTPDINVNSDYISGVGLGGMQVLGSGGGIIWGAWQCTRAGSPVVPGNWILKRAD
jgi:hypothetical protein